MGLHTEEPFALRAEGNGHPGVDIGRHYMLRGTVWRFDTRDTRRLYTGAS